MKKIYDVIISGAGPSGSLLAYLLSKKNIKTLIIEKEKFPRSKVCAGGLQQKALDLIPFNIDSVIKDSANGIYFSRKKSDLFYKEYGKPIMATVDRAQFDDYFLDKAVSKGTEIKFKEKIRDLKIQKNQTEVICSGSTYHSRVFAGADGAAGFTIKRFNDYKKILKITGYEAEIEQSDFSLKEGVRFDGRLALDFSGFKKGYLWIFPKNNQISIGAGGPFKNSSSIKKYLNEFIAYNPYYELKEGKINSIKINAHFIPVRQDKDFVCSFRVIALGDAACLGDGFTGEGLFNAFLSSHYASESIFKAFDTKNFDFTDYYEKINNDIYGNIKKSILISKIFFSSALFYYKLIKNNDNLFNACCKILRGEKSYSEVVNKLKLFKI